MTELPILLPEGFTPLVSAGDTVHIEQPLAKRETVSGTVTISIAEELGIPPEKAGKMIKKNPGDTISPGDTIAIRSGLLGMGGQKVVSSVKGKIVSYERRTSELTIQIEGEEETTEDEQLLSPVDGKVLLVEDSKIILKTEKDSIIAQVGIGTNAKGVVLALSHEPTSPVPLHVLTPEIIGKVIVGHTFDRDGLLKAIGMEAAGIIVNAIDETDASYLTEKNYPVPLVQVTNEDYQKITKWSGKQIFLDGEKKNVVLLHL